MTEPGTIRWGRIIGVLLVTALVLEVVARLFVLVWVGRPFESFAKYRFSPYGLVRNNPRTTLPGFEHDSSGFRNLEEFSRTKPPRTLRVLLLGASVTYSGLGSDMLDDAERPTSHEVINRYLADALRADPDLRGLQVEVINASVPFNRGFEMASAYMAEYAAWDADVVIVMGSANNFLGPPPPAALLAQRNYGMEGQHPWAWDFERLANQRTLLVLLEQALLVAEDSLASAALLRKFASRAADFVVRARDRLDPTVSTRGPRQLAHWNDYDRYVDRVIGVMDAMKAIARANDQEIVFFWEYYLRHLSGIRPYSRAEAKLMKRLGRGADDLVDASYNFHARDRVAAWCRRSQVPFLDPIDVLKSDRTSIFIDYLHYTPAGNEIMARYMHRELRNLFHRRGEITRRRGGMQPAAD